MEGIIYSVTSPSGKVYIGQTTQKLGERKAAHERSAKFGEGYALHAALNKYGADKFSWKVEIDGIEDFNVLNYLEQFFIRHFDSLTPFGYNLTTGGGNSKMSEETRKKMSESHKGKVFSEEHRKNISKSAKEVSNRSEIKKQRSIASRKAYENQELKQRISDISKEIQNRPEVKKKKSEAAKRQHANPVTAEKMRECKRGSKNPMWGKKLSKEHREKISKKMKERIRIQKEKGSE